MFTCSIASISNSLAFFAKSIGEISPFEIEPFIDHCAKEILYFLALILFNLSTSIEAKPNNEDDNKPEKFLLFKTSILSITKYKNLIMNCNFMKINHLMKIKTIPLFLMLFLISCKNEPAKERFSYERVQENEKKIERNEQTIVLNSNDLMLFDKTSLSAKAGKNIRLVLNHTGKIGKEFMGHNFVLLKKDVDWIQPSTQVGSKSNMPTLSFDQILETAKKSTKAQINSWSDIDRLDVRIEKGIVKVRARNRWEVQIDTYSGKILNEALRRSDLIENIHDGSWFNDFVKKWIFLPSGFILLILWLTGVYLVLLPYFKKWQRR